MTEAALATLRGRRILVAEDECMIAREIEEALAESGVEMLGPAPSIDDALNLIASELRIDGALLDVHLRSEAIWTVVDALLERDVPVVLTTGYDASAIPPPYAHLPRCEKPTTPRDLTRALTRAMHLEPKS